MSMKYALLTALTLALPTLNAAAAVAKPAVHTNPTEVNYAVQQAASFAAKMNKTSEHVSAGSAYADGQNILCVACENLTQRFIATVTSPQTNDGDKTAALEWLFGVYVVLEQSFRKDEKFTTPELQGGEFSRHNHTFFARTFGKL